VCRMIVNLPCHAFQRILDFLRFLQQLHMNRRIKVYIRQRGKQHIFDKVNHAFVNLLPLRKQRLAVTADTLNLKNQQILQIGNLRRFSANAQLRTALAVCRLLALIAKHFIA